MDWELVRADIWLYVLTAFIACILTYLKVTRRYEEVSKKLVVSYTFWQLVKSRHPSRDGLHLLGLIARVCSLNTVFSIVLMTSYVLLPIPAELKGSLGIPVALMCASLSPSVTEIAIQAIRKAKAGALPGQAGKYSSLRSPVRKVLALVHGWERAKIAAICKEMRSANNDLLLEIVGETVSKLREECGPNAIQRLGEGYSQHVEGVVDYLGGQTEPGIVYQVLRDIQTRSREHLLAACGRYIAFADERLGGTAENEVRSTVLFPQTPLHRRLVEGISRGCGFSCECCSAWSVDGVEGLGSCGKGLVRGGEKTARPAWKSFQCVEHECVNLGSMIEQ